MLFSLSILLVLLFSQVFLMEPFYKATLKKDIMSLNRNIYDIMISDMEEDEARWRTVHLYEGHTVRDTTGRRIIYPSSQERNTYHSACG